MYFCFHKYFDRGFALGYIGDKQLENSQQICNLKNLEIALEKFFYTLLTVKFLGHDIKTIDQVSSKVDHIQKVNTPPLKSK